MLDPFPYGSGVMTNLEAFSIGTPVVTIPSKSSNMPCTAGLYKRMGLQGLVAQTEAEYVRIAVHLGNLGVQGQTQLRQTIQKQARTTLFENEDTVHEWAEFIEKAALGINQEN